MNKKETPIWLQITAFVVVVGTMGWLSFSLVITKNELAEANNYTSSVESALEMANIERSNAISDGESAQAILKEAITELVAENSTYTDMDLAGLTESEMAVAYLAEIEMRPTGIPFSVDTFRTTSAFGWRVNPVTGVTEFQAASDIVPSGGDRLVYPSAPGVIVDIGMDPVFGKWIVVEHNASYRTFYAHLDMIFYQDEANSRTVGERVYEDTPMGTMGSTGQSTGPHLHYEVRKLVDGTWKRQNPAHYLGIRRRD